MGPDHPDTLTTRHQIARMLANRGLHEQAEQEYRDVLAAQLRVLGPDHPSTRITQDSLAALESQLQPPSRSPADQESAALHSRTSTDVHRRQSPSGV